MGRPPFAKRGDVTPDRSPARRLTLADGVFHLEAAADLADGLAEPLLVLDQGEAEVALAHLAEAPAGADGDLGLLEQFHGEVDRAHARAPGLGDRRPDEHARLGAGDVPAETVEAVDEHVPTLLVF